MFGSAPIYGVLTSCTRSSIIPWYKTKISRTRENHRKPCLVCKKDCWAMGIREIFFRIIWAPSSEFVSSSIPSWQILTAHAQPFRGARDLAFCLKVPLVSLLVWASSGGSGETARMRRLAWTFAARIGDKYQICLTRSIWMLLTNYMYLDCFKEKNPK